MFYTDKGISKIALGTALYGSQIDKKTAFEMMDVFFENGGNLLDTARGYASWIEGGKDMSEKTIGEYIKSRSLRNKAVISTKGGQPHDGLIPRLSKEELCCDIEESLTCLDIDCVDIYYLHRDDLSKSVEEIMPILHRFVKDGKTKCLGASNWTFERIKKANDFAKNNGLTPFTYSQVMWSYASVNKKAVSDDTLVVMDKNEYEKYKNSNITLMAFSSQAQGFFNKGNTITGYYRDVYLNEENLEKFRKVQLISKETGISPTAVSLNYFLYNDVQSISIVGGKNTAQIIDSLTALNLSEEYAKTL